MDLNKKSDALAAESTRSVEVYYSYAPEDERWQKELEKQLSGLKRKGLIVDWNKHRVSAGMEKAVEIDAHINSAAIILLLVSPDFIASDYCYGFEVSRAMERHEAGEARVIPIILRPTDWSGTPFDKLQALPTNDKPITKWSNRDDAFLDVVKGIREAVETLILQKSKNQRTEKNLTLSSIKRYDVALSYASEDRAYAESLAKALRQRGVKVFYDRYEKAALWGQNLYTYLSDLYQNQAHYSVLFLSQHYASKLWTSHERKAAQARAFKEQGDYILPIRLDETEIPGLLPTLAYLSWPPETAESIADAILEKLGKPVQNFPVTKSVETKVTHELPAEHEKRMQEQMGGMFDFRQAINARDWKQAEKVLQKYPNLPEGRSLLGLGMSNEVREYFFHQLRQGTSLQVHESLGGPVTPMYYTQFAQTPPAPPTLEAIHWLEEALQHQDNPEGNVTASLALMYGFNEDYGRMIATIKKARTINSSIISYFQRTDNLMMLIYACHDLASVEEVMRNVNLKLPQKDEVQQAIREATDPKNNPYALAQPYIEWYAVELRMGRTSKMPVTVRIIFLNKNGTTYAQVSPLSHASITIPKQTSTNGIIDTFIPVEDILKRLTDIGIVLITLI
jgi:hypothetical protein